MNNRILIIILSVIIVLQMATTLFILKKEPLQGPPPPPPLGFMEDDRGPGMGMEMRMGKHHMKGNRFGQPFCEQDFLKDKLSLDQKQIEKIDDLNRKFDVEFSRYIAQIEPERKKLKDILDRDVTDLKAVREQLKKIEDINIEIHLLRIKQGKEISGILTSEQMNKLRKERNMFFEKISMTHGEMR